MEGLTLENIFIQKEYMESQDMYWLFFTAEDCGIQNSFCEVSHEHLAMLGDQKLLLARHA